MPKKGKQTVKESKNQASGLPRRDVLKGTAAVALGFSAFAHLSMNSAEAAETAAPAISAMLIYILMAAILVVRPQGLFPPKGR